MGQSGTELCTMLWLLGPSHWLLRAFFCGLLCSQDGCAAGIWPDRRSDCGIADSPALLLVLQWSSRSLYLLRGTYCSQFPGDKQSY
jgi:hypothetical protein